MGRRAVRSPVDMRPLRAAMDRMSIPLRRIRQSFTMRAQRTESLCGQLWWRQIGDARIGGFFGFITDARGWEHLEPAPVLPEAVVFAFVRPLGHPLHRRLVAAKGSLFEKVARQSRYEAVPFDLYRDRAEALVRHRSMRGRPDEILVLTACDFLMTSMRAYWASDFFEEIRKVRPAKRKAKS